MIDKRYYTIDGVVYVVDFEAYKDGYEDQTPEWVVEIDSLWNAETGAEVIDTDGLDDKIIELIIKELEGQE